MDYSKLATSELVKLVVRGCASEYAQAAAEKELDRRIPVPVGRHPDDCGCMTCKYKPFPREWGH